MNLPFRCARSESRLFQVLGPARLAGPTWRTRKQPPSRRQAAVWRPCLEWLETRATISDALFSSVWPGLLLKAEAFSSPLEVAGTAGEVAWSVQDSDRAAPVRAAPAPPLELAEETAAAALSLGSPQPAAPGPAASFGDGYEFLGVEPGTGAGLFPLGVGYGTVLGNLFPLGGEAWNRGAAAAAPAAAGTAPAAGLGGSPVGAIPEPGEVAPSPATADVWPPAGGPGTAGGGGGGVELALVARINEIQEPGFEVSWQAGGYDQGGRFMGGTELMQLEPHGGKLFAGTGVFLDVPGNDPRVGAQILRLDAPNGRWQVDHHFGNERYFGQMRFTRVEDMESVRFTTDGQGIALPQPVQMLLAAPIDLTGRTAVYSRHDPTGAWTEMVLAQGAPFHTIRSLWFHRDTATGVDRVFAGVTGIGTFSGVYDPSVPGRIRWDTLPEFTHIARTTGFAEIGGVLYTTPSDSIDQRTDGRPCRWQSVYEYTSGLLRGLTALQYPRGGPGVLLVSTEAHLGEETLILRLDPSQGFRATTELNVSQFLRTHWRGLARNSVLAGYNEMTPVIDPTTGGTIHVIGLLAHPPASVSQTSTWYLIRHADARYELREIRARPHPRIPVPDLKATRSVVVSPFAADAGRVLYFGGYDVEWEFFTTHHNTAWIYRAPIEVVVGLNG